MTNTRLSDQNVIEILSATNLEAKDTHARDPLVKARVRVTRTTRNPKFDDIMASIENAGLEQPPNMGYFDISGRKLPRNRLISLF